MSESADEISYFRLQMHGVNTLANQTLNFHTFVDTFIFTENGFWCYCFDNWLLLMKLALIWADDIQHRSNLNSCWIPVLWWRFDGFIWLKGTLISVHSFSSGHLLFAFSRCNYVSLGVTHDLLVNSTLNIASTYFQYNKFNKYSWKNEK